MPDKIIDYNQISKEATELAMWMNCETVILIHEMKNQKVIYWTSPEKWHDGDFFCKILYKRLLTPLCSG